eukprot:TRINITY_DN3769_c0_g2_i1.p1 TRINITY_DN3769_c0_g2~~TRINITY_DN3769_c0_g2_i1.p1  ORF type:complete len:134 (-),score=17.29 TRINITY_DN3769_c0_g2_i1:417-818(-)
MALLTVSSVSYCGSLFVNSKPPAFVSNFRSPQNSYLQRISAFGSKKHLVFDVISSRRSITHFSLAPSPTFSIPEAVEWLIERKDFSEQQAEGLLDLLLDDGANEAQIGSFLVLLRSKGETFEEVGLLLTQFCP